MIPEMETAVKYQSHLPALLACIASSEGAVLELGVGHFSTPHLHALCGAMNRQLVSVEQDAEWYAEFAGKYEKLRHVFGNKFPPHVMMNFGVGFVDHSPGGANRAEAFRLLLDWCDYVVVHDAQKDAENVQAIEPMLAGLNWHLCTSIFPHTLCASKTRQIPEVLKDM